MSKRWFTSIIAIVLVLLLANAVFGLEAFKVKSYITDGAGLLNESEAASLANALWKYDQATGNQLLVVTVPSLEGSDPAAFAEDLFSLNKPGQKGKDNGLILFIAKAERKIRIEVGYGLEPVLPDGKAGAIIRDFISPYFKNNEYSYGIKAGLTAMVNAITPGYEFTSNVAVDTRPHAEKKDNDWGKAWFFAMIIFGITLLGNANGARNQRRRYRRGFSEPWLWGGGGGFGGGGFGGGSSGGGFSGGGGSFGGGGASGGW